jgi:hypothetical protein
MNQLLQGFFLDVSLRPDDYYHLRHRHHNQAAARACILEELKPTHVIMADPAPSFARQVVYDVVFETVFDKERCLYLHDFPRETAFFSTRVCLYFCLYFVALLCTTMYELDFMCFYACGCCMQLERYQAGRRDADRANPNAKTRPPVKLYLLCYAESVEEQRYLTSVIDCK